MTLLVRTPSPHLTESLLGYVLRVSEENGYDTPWHVLRLSGIAQGQMRTAGFPVAKFAAVLGKSADALAHIAYQERSDGMRHFKILRHRLGQGLKEGPFRLKHPALCPQCVAEQGYIDAFWDLTAAVACPRHGTSALRACPSCKARINWFRPGLLKCKCGAAFDEHEPSPVSGGLRTLMNFFYAKLRRVPLAEMGNSYGFPLQQLDNIPFGSLLQIVRGLGHWNITSQAFDAQDDEHLLMAAVESLQDWPAGFHGMLRRLGEKSLKNGVEGAGLRKQFHSFYENMFKGRDSTPHAGFLREEFIVFGKFHWGQALVDEKLLRKHSKQEQNAARFISKTEFSKRYGLWKPTMDRLIETGAISTKRIKTGKAARILVDVDRSTLPAESRGIVSVREAARHAGLPVSVLQWARKVGLYVTKVRAVGSEVAWHQDDVDEFIERGLALAPSSICGADGVTVRKAMHLHLRGESAKPDILCAMFDGRLRVVGRDGNNFAGLLLDSRELADLVRLKRIASLNGTYSALNVSEETGLDPMVVATAVAEGMLEKEVVDGQHRTTRRSIDSFRSRYIPLAKLSSELGTSARTLQRCCRKNDISVIDLERKNKRGKQLILLRMDEGRLRAVWAERPEQRAAQKQSRNQGEAAQTALLRDYLDDLTRRANKLPRLASRPNKALIAKAAGFGRSTFYSYTALVEMLDAHDAAERRQDESILVAPLIAIQRYLSQLRDNKMALAAGYGGKPNLMAISKACGCSRNVFYNNPDAQRMLNDFASTANLPG